MKKLSAILVGLGFSLIFSSNTILAAPVWSVRLDILDPVVVGSAFDINVVAEGLIATDEVFGFGLDVIHSSSFKLNKATVGTGFTDVSGSFAKNDVAGVAFPAISGGDDITLVTINFTPSLAGTFSLMLFSDLADANEGLFILPDTQWDITKCTKVEVAPVPLPTTSLLLGSGLAGLLVLRRRRRR